MPLSPIWTINGTAFADLGLSRLRIEFLHAKPGRATFIASGRAIDSPLLFTTDQPITIQKNGANWFQGFCKKPAIIGHADSEDHHYEAVDVLDLLNRSTYCQPRTTFTVTVLGGTITVKEVTQLTPNLFFGVDQNGNQLTLAQELTNILNFAKASGINFQIGTIQPNQEVPYDSDKSLTCGQAINKRLRWAPLLTVSVDHSTNPVTINIVEMQNQPAITLPIGKDASGDAAYVTADITLRDDLKMKGVILFYEQLNQANGVGYLNIVPDVAGAVPLDGNGNPSNPGAVDTLTQVVELLGSTSQNLTATINTRPIPLASDDAGMLAFFKLHCPELRDSNLSSVTIVSGSATRVLDPVAYPNELLPGTGGQIAPWMTLPTTSTPVLSAVDTLMARFVRTYTDGKGAGYKDNTAGILKTITITATNAVANAAPLTLTQLQSFTPGEPIPTGVAAWLDGIFSATIYEGPVAITEPECSGTVRVGKVLNLTNGAAAWATMNALIQRVVEEIDTGKTTVTCGAPPHLSARDFISLLEAARNRQNGDFFLSITGTSSSGGPLPLGTGTPLLAPTTGESGKTRQVHSDGTTTIQQDIADLNSGTTAKLQDITFVSDVSWDGTNLKQTKSISRVLCVPPSAQPPTIIDTPTPCS